MALSPVGIRSPWSLACYKCASLDAVQLQISSLSTGMPRKIMRNALLKSTSCVQNILLTYQYVTKEEEVFLSGVTGLSEPALTSGDHPSLAFVSALIHSTSVLAAGLGLAWSPPWAFCTIPLLSLLKSTTFDFLPFQPSLQFCAVPGRATSTRRPYLQHLPPRPPNEPLGSLPPWPCIPQARPPDPSPATLLSELGSAVCSTFREHHPKPAPSCSCRKGNFKSPFLRS